MILLYPGCLYRHKLPHLLEKYEDVLSGMDVDFIRLDTLSCCGMPLRFAGYADDFLDVARRNVERIHAGGITEIITLCPECHRLFEKHYRKAAGLDPAIQVSFISCVLRDRVKASAAGRGAVTYQDPCYLGRRSGIYDAPRDLIARLGFDLIEPENTRERTGCCGGGGNVRDHDLELSESVARARVAEFRSTGADCIVTNCPHCYVCLSGKGMPVNDVSELFPSQSRRFA